MVLCHKNIFVHINPVTNLTPNACSMAIHNVHTCMSGQVPQSIDNQALVGNTLMTPDAISPGLLTVCTKFKDHNSQPKFYTLLTKHNGSMKSEHIILSLLSI